MQEARRLLRNTNLRIYEVSEACGYKNELYFSRVFVKENGLTPISYRRSFTENKSSDKKSSNRENKFSKI